MRIAGDKRDRRRGQVLLMTTLVLVPLLAIMGLAVDVGYMQFVKAAAQTAADAAALGAISQFHATVSGSSFSCGGNILCQEQPASCPSGITTPANPIQNGCLYAAEHGFTPGGNKNVTYQAGTSATPPTAPGVTNAGYWVRFRVSQTVPQLFSAVQGHLTGTVSASATAAMTPSKDCIYALSKTAPAGISVGGTASLVSSCGVYVNSNSPTALSTNGSGQISATSYDVVGGTSTHDPLDPPPNTGAPPTSDPLAGMPPPASAPYHCDYKNFNGGNHATVTLSPGVYCGGINVGNSTYTFNPGTYILVGGGLSTQSANSHIVGTGVMFYNTFGATNQGNFAYSPIDINANSTVSLSAPTSGTYAGILFFEDRAAPPSSDSYGGGSSAKYEGTIYAPNADITLFGNSSVTSGYTIIVANTISLVGTSGINNNYSGLSGGTPIKGVSLVE